MGSSSSQKVQVSEYRMSLHLGFCHAVDHLLEILVKEKTVWSGDSTGNTLVGITQPSLFGGVKKEGGLVGTVEVLHGRSDQVLPENLASKLGTTSADAPGFRDILSLFFHGGDRGFLWSANYPYLHSVWAKVSRTNSGWYAAKSAIGEKIRADASGYSLSSNVSIADGLQTWPVITKVVGDRVHVTYSQACPDNYIHGPSMPIFPIYNAPYYVIDANTGGVVDDYLGPCAHYRPLSAGWFGVWGSTTAEAWHFVGQIGERWLWWYANHFNDGGSPKQQYLCFSPQGFNPSPTQAVLTEDMDFFLDFVSGVFVDNENEVALVIISRPSTGTSRWVEYFFDGTSGRSGNCDFYGIGAATPPAATGSLTVYYLPLGLGQFNSGVQSGCYDYLNWTAFSVNSGKQVAIFQIDGSNTLKFVKTTAGVPTAYSARAATLVKDGAAVIVTQMNPPYTTPAAVGTLSSGFSKTSVGPQMNPAHIIREVLTNADWGLGIDEEMIDDASFTAAADTLYDEGFGLSLRWTGQSSAEDFINDILAHIDATYGNDPATGKFYIKLIRGDYDPDDLDELTDDHITITSFTRNSLSDTSNEVVVTWTNPESEEEQTVTVHDIANYSAQGVIISTSRNYHAVRTSDLALRCAMRELGKVSQPVATFEVDANRMAIDYKSGDVVKVTYPEYGLNGLPCRVMSISRGKPGQMAVKMTLMEDVFNMPSSAYAVSPGSGWEDTSADDMPVNVYKIESAPYYLVVKEIGDAAASSVEYPETYAMILATGAGAEYGVYTSQVDPLGNTAYTLQGSREYAGTATLGVAIGKAVTSTFTVNGLTSDPAAGTIFFLGDELCIVESYSAGSITARRGMLDTVPVDHSVGERLWFFTSQDDIADPNAYTVGQTVNYKLVPEGQTTSGAIVLSATLGDRLYRPYRPANVKINGSLWPTVITGPVVVTWSHRNRTLETSVLNKWDAGSVTVEAGTTYTLRFYGEADTLLHTVTGLTGTTYTWSTEETDAGRLQGRVRVELEAVRDGYVSLQKFDHAFDRAGYGLNYGNYYGGI